MSEEKHDLCGCGRRVYGHTKWCIDHVGLGWFSHPLKIVSEITVEVEEAQSAFGVAPCALRLKLSYGSRAVKTGPLVVDPDTFSACPIGTRFKLVKE